MSLPKLKLSCIVRTGIPLGPYAVELLYQTACQMYARQASKGKAHFNEEVYATVNTEGETVCIGGLVGIQFVGEVVTEKGISQMDFLVRECDLETPIPMEMSIWEHVGPERPDFIDCDPPDELSFDPSSN